MAKEDEFYEKQSLWENCGCRLTATANESGSGRGARIAYLVTMHNQRTLEDSMTLMKAIASPHNIILIHIDSKMNMDDYDTSSLASFIEGECKACGASILVESKFDLAWGTWSMNDPTHWSMMELTSNPQFVDQWDVFINVSADTLPVYIPSTLSALFAPPPSLSSSSSSYRTLNKTKNGYSKGGPLYNVNFVTASSCVTGLHPTHIEHFPASWHKRKHYDSSGDFVISYEEGFSQDGSFTDTDTDTTQMITSTETIDIYFGSQWMALSPSFVEYLATSLQKEDSFPSRLKEEFIQRKVLMTDETFIPTILMHHPNFSRTLPVLSNQEDNALEAQYVSGTSIKSIRYERMDENMPDAFGHLVYEQRYEVPASLSSKENQGWGSNIVDVPRAWGPYYLGVYDLGNIKDSGALFVRKVNRHIDPNLELLLPVGDRDDIPAIYWPNEVKVSKLIDWDRLIEEFQRRKETKELQRDV